MLCFILLSVIPVLLIGCTTYLICSRVIMGMAEDSAKETIDMVCADLELFFDNTYSLCTMVSGDINMQENIRREFGSIAEQYSTDLKGSMELAFISTYEKNVFGLYVLGENGGQYKSNAASFRVEDFKQSQWYQTIITGDNPVWFAPHEWSFVVKTVNDRFFSVGIPLADKASGEKKGVVLADVKEEAVTALMCRGFSKQGYLFLMDGQGNIIARPEKAESAADADRIEEIRRQAIDARLSAADGTGWINAKNYLIISRELGRTGWQIVGAADKEAIIRSNYVITFTVAGMLLAAVVISVLAAARISETMTRPLRTLTELMEHVEGGDLSVQMQIQYQDEIGRLGKSFNHMLEQMQLLMQQIYDEQRELRRSELRALQNQIKPHFLYNSLDSATWLLRMGKTEEAQRMLTALTKLFMVALSKGREVITIEEELRHVTSYLIIESMVYSKKFEYEVVADPEVMQNKTPKLLLQPLVENSIYHGIKSKNTKEKITVEVRAQGEEVVLCVRDTGAGILPERLEQIRARLQTGGQEQGDRESYGIFSVNERIQLFYGKQYGVKIDSGDGKGTSVTIRIPAIGGDDDHADSDFMR